MLRCDVSDIQTELDWVHQRLERNQVDLVEQLARLLHPACFQGQRHG